MLLLGFFALSTAFNIVNPLWEGIDEPGHFQYVKYVAENHQLPSKGQYLPTLSSSDANCANVHCVGRGRVTDQPPLYYLLVAPFVLPIDLNVDTSWVANPYFTWPNYPLRNAAAIHTLTEAWPYQGMVLGAHVMRAVSGLMAAGALAAIYFAALALRRSSTFALLATGIAALTPGFLLTSASINDDNAAILTGALALLFAVKTLTARSRTWLWLTLLAAMTVLALLSKTSMVFLLPVFALVLGVLWLRQRTVAPTAWKLEGGAAAVMIVGALLLERFKLQKVPGGIRHQVGYQAGIMHQALIAPKCHCPGPGQAFWGSIPDLFETYWGSFGWETFHLPSPFYRPFLFFTLLAAVGVCLAAFRVRRRRIAFAALQLGLLVLLVEVIYRDVVTASDGGTTHARFLFPAIMASTLLLAVGLWSLPRLMRYAGFGGLYATSLAAIGFAIWVLPHSFGPTPPVYGDTVSAGVQHTANIAFEQGMRYRGITLASTAVQPGTPLHLKLFWDEYRKVDFDYSTFVRLVGPGGAIIHDSDHGLGQGVGLLSRAWQIGEVIPDSWTIAIPKDARPGDYTIEVGVYDYRDLKPVLDQDAQPMTVVGHVTVRS